MVSQHYQYIGDVPYWVTDGRVFVDGAFRDGYFGLPVKDIQDYLHWGLGTLYAQFHQIVLPGLGGAQHVFRGLRRPLYNDDNPESGEEKLIYTWKPDFDVVVENRTAQRIAAPKGAVFTVIVSPNLKHRKTAQKIDAFIGHWSWVDEDSVLEGAPKGWVERYDERLTKE